MNALRTAPPVLALAAALACAGTKVYAQATEVTMHKVDENGVQEAIGTVVISATADGVTFTPALKGLPPGPHGFHVHEKPDCGPALDPEKGKAAPAMAAGPHLDPEGTKRHRGPREDGHLGDLPVLEVDESGNAQTAVLAARLKLSDLNNHALVIHAGADNYSDEPAKLGGGGTRIACGIIKIVRTTRSTPAPRLAVR